MKHIDRHFNIEDFSRNMTSIVINNDTKEQRNSYYFILKRLLFDTINLCAKIKIKLNV